MKTLVTIEITEELAKKISDGGDGPERGVAVLVHSALKFFRVYEDIVDKEHESFFNLVKKDYPELYDSDACWKYRECVLNYTVLRDYIQHEVTDITDEDIDYPKNLY